ncbi:hypothetical protein [Granulicella arctica]|uniref:hypothetical protein n=1 Tax=Granulicella arctica TaxID=940613 RepID=UPI0021DFC10A|nr:hypothetical protein [Granulicella arctica]
MAGNNERIDVIAADVMEGGGLLIHFSNETATLFQAQFLFDARDQDGNVPIVEEGDEVSGVLND